MHCKHTQHKQIDKFCRKFELSVTLPKQKSMKKKKLIFLVQFVFSSFYSNLIFILFGVKLIQIASVSARCNAKRLLCLAQSCSKHVDFINGCYFDVIFHQQWARGWLQTARVSGVVQS